MKKKYIKPELVNIITVGGGKNNQTAELMGQTKIIMIGDHVSENLESNIFHSVSITKHITYKNRIVSSAVNAAKTFYIKFTNTPTSKQIGPS